MLEDLDKIRDDPHGVVIDLQFPVEGTIGEVRAIMADVVMEANYRLKTVKPLILADADIRSVEGSGGYAALTQPLLDNPDIDAVIGSYYLDPETVKNDQTFYLRKRLDHELYKILDEYLPPSPEDKAINGAAAAINLLRLPVLGGIPRVSIGEDHVLSKKIKQHARNSQQNVAIVTSEEFQLALSASRDAYDFRHSSAGMFGEEGGSRYTNWEGSANKPRPVVDHYDLDKDHIIRYAGWYLSYYRDGSGRKELIDSVGLAKYEECIQRVIACMKEILTPYEVEL